MFSLLSLGHFLPSLFNVHPLYEWPSSTQQCLHDIPIPISSALSLWDSFLLKLCLTTSSPSAFLTSYHLLKSNELMLCSVSMPPPFASGPKIAPGKKIDKHHRIHFIRLLPLKDHSHRLLIIQCLKTVSSSIFLIFRISYDSRLSPVLVTTT